MEIPGREMNRIKFKFKDNKIVEAGTLALEILKLNNQKYTAQEEAFFVAGFETGIQYILKLQNETEVKDGNI